MPLINEKTLKYLADLARVDVSGMEEKLTKDLGGILNYFEQLKEVNTDGVEPMTGGTFEKNVFREDASEIKKEINATNEEIIEAFPEKECGFLKVPPVFE